MLYIRYTYIVHGRMYGDFPARFCTYICNIHRKYLSMYGFNQPYTHTP